MADKASSPSADVLAELSKEIALSCDEAGRVSWMDARTQKLFSATDGKRLSELVAPGAREKADELLTRARGGEVSGWELPLVLAGRPISFAFSARPTGGGKVVLVGSIVPEHYSAALTQVSETMTELSSLHRQSERQKVELKRHGDELARVNLELSESNRGLMTLYQELDDKSDSLRRASEVKSRVVANVSHEFRTPLNSITGLARLLLSHVDGPLTPEQEKQVSFILKSADELSLMVNDLLDLSKLESGKTQLRPVRFDAQELASALRGMLRPLHQNDNVGLVFDVAADVPTLETDESKISQILRNLLSNALKFTERGEIRLTVRKEEGDRISFAVSDTGVGIAPEDHARVFEEFTQVDSPIQRKVKGTGLGLSLSRRLAEFLGGTLMLQSELGKGATFTLTVPRVHPEVQEMAALEKKSERVDPFKSPVLVVEDDRQTMFLYEKYLQGSGFQVIPARSVEDARTTLQRLRPAAIVLDVILEGETTWTFLADLKRDPNTRDIPVLVVTVTDREQKARALGADEFWLKPLDQHWLLKKLRAMARLGPVERVLVIDDDEVSRYLVRRLLADTSYAVLEAGGGHEGIRLAREQQPQVILLDFVLPDMSAFDVIDDLKTHPITRTIPVIIHTSRDLDAEERRRLSSDAAAILQKQALSRELALGRIRDALMKAGVTPVTSRS